MDKADIGNALPRFPLPEVVGVVMSAETIAAIVQQSVEAMAQGLQCTRLIALSVAPQEGLLRGVTTVGIEYPRIRELMFPLSELIQAERALRTGQILVLSDSTALAPHLAPYFSGEIVVVPLQLGGRSLAVLIGQVAPGTLPRSAVWQERAQEVAARAALVVELERLASAYQDELRLRQSSRAIAASILEGRPLQEVAEQVVETVALRLREERVALYLHDDAKSRFRPAALRNISAEYGDNITRLTRPGPVIARAIATGLPHHARDVQNDAQIPPEVRSLFRREGITNVLAATLHHGDTITGGLIVYPNTERNFTPAEIAIFQSFADQAALAVAMTKLLEQQREMAVMEERNRLAREMHDTVAQALAALVLQLEIVQTRLDNGSMESAVEMLTDARAQARKGLEETRRAVQGLSPASLERLTTAQAIAEEVRHFEEETGVSARFVPTGEEQPLLPDQQGALLRIATEALTNARKHAQAQRVRVGLQYGAESVTLLVEDDGVGFDLGTATSQDTEGGYGLFGMNERARLLDGELLIDSTPGWGTRIRATLPYRAGSPFPQKARGGEGERLPVPAAEFSGALASHTGEPPVGRAPMNTYSGTRVLVVDDHAMTRQGIRALLEANGEITVVGEAGNGQEAALLAHTLRPDVVLMDLQMPGVDGIEGLKRIHAEQPELPVVILTTFQTEETVTAALAAGARGFLLKDTEPANLIAAVLAAQRGEALLSPSVTGQLASLASGQGGKADADALNERELEVLQLLAQGSRNKEIAARLFITPRTVEYHLGNIFGKLGVSNRTEAARAALERNLVSSDPRILK